MDIESHTEVGQVVTAAFHAGKLDPALRDRDAELLVHMEM